MADWQQIHVASDHHEAIEERLSELGALAVSLSDAADSPVFEPAPGEILLWPKMIVTGLFEMDADLPSIKQDLLSHALCESEHVQIETLADRCWEREWLNSFAPMCFGQRLWVSPHEADVVWPQDAVVLRMDPGLAFGTGTHPTTRLCLQWLDGVDLRGKRVIDFGCGSGVLAVAAALLGATEVIAYDIDPQAMIATQANALANGVADKITLLQPEHPPQEPADIVLANILAKTLIELHDTITNLVGPNGQLVMSGILMEQAQSVSLAYSEQFLLTPENSEAWVRLDGARFAPLN